jgi:UDP-glucuronate decarboxylase
VSNFIRQALDHHPLTVYGDGQQTRSFCYVSDLVDGLVRLMESDVGHDPVNLGNPRETTMLELARLVRRLAHSSAPVRHEPLPTDDPVRRRPDITRAQERLGWAPTVPLEEGLRLTIDDFRRRRTAPQRHDGAAA